MDKLKHKFTSCLAAALALMLAAWFGLGALAASPIFDQKGSLTLVMKYRGEPLPGGTMSICKIAFLEQNDNAYSFVWARGFEDSGLIMREYSTKEFAERAAMLVESRSLPSQTRSVGSNGTVTFSDLDSGLYVVYQLEPPEGYEPINAFCIMIPLEDEDGLVFDIVASPKPRPEKTEPSQPETTTGATEPDGTTKPGDTTAPDPGTTRPGSTTKPNDEGRTEPSTEGRRTEEEDRLPRTGQLWWPAWVFGTLGFVLFGVGIAMRAASKRFPDPYTDVLGG